MLISDAGQPIKISVATANQNADIGRWSANKNICSDRAHFTCKHSPDSWRISNTSLIKKKDKPGIKDFRPIAVCSLGYKLFWAAVRQRMEDQVKRYGLVKDSNYHWPGMC